MAIQIDLSNQVLYCGCQECGRRFEFNYGRAAENKAVTCPACGAVMEVGDQLERIEREVERVTREKLKVLT